MVTKTKYYVITFVRDGEGGTFTTTMTFNDFISRQLLF